ncbi:hypothetical protein BKA65DRAFT_480525 [Rhexocercosporidium sp. MPI-PUGE-AT-0058]|nr:hypothetical protein BKA65DRAFT_480525 [Rhexocercosporidium sp. MPI-PUGE-AT-0058]
MASHGQTPSPSYFIPTLYAIDKSGFLYDILTLNLSPIPESTLQSFFTSIDQIRKNLSKQREDLARFKRLCKALSSVRNATDYERLFLIRYQDPVNPSEPRYLRDFLKKLSVAAFVKVIFKISYAELVAIEGYLDDFAGVLGEAELGTRHLKKLKHLEGFKRFEEELVRENGAGAEVTASKVVIVPEPEPCGFVFSRVVRENPEACVEGGGESSEDVVMRDSLEAAAGIPPSQTLALPPPLHLKDPNPPPQSQHVAVSPPVNTLISEEVNPRAITTVNNLSGRTILGFLSKHIAPVESTSMVMEEAHGVINLNYGLGPPNWDPKCIRIQLTLGLAHALVRYTLRADG